MDIIHSSGGGVLPELPEWAVNIKRTVTMELEVDRNDELKEVEGERRFQFLWVFLFFLNPILGVGEELG